MDNTSLQLLDTDKTTYCGHGLYVDLGEYRFFNKQADGTVSEINDNIVDAERRYINRHINEEVGIDG